MLEIVNYEEIKMRKRGSAEVLSNGVVEKPKRKFRDEHELSAEQLTDPDFRLKQLASSYGDKFRITCSKCHHCRK